MNRSKPKVSALWILVFVVVFSPVLLGGRNVLAATYYVDGTTGSDTAGNGSSSSPWKTIKKGVTPLEPGDTLVVRDGTYTGEQNNLCGPFGGWDQMPSGAPGQYITIRAENYLGAIIDGGDQYAPVSLWENRSYLTFENFFFRNGAVENGGSNFRAQDCHHIRVLNCASEEAYFGHFWFRNSHHCLVEGCAAWGRSAYSFVFVGEYDDYTRSQYNIARRCVSRRDVHFYPDHQANHFASFVAYWADHTYFLNCISIDGIHVEDEGNVPDDDFIATTTFFTTNGASNYHVIGCIALNDVGQIASTGPGDREIIRFQNNAVFMNTNSTFGVVAYVNNDLGITPPTFYALNNTLGNVHGTGEYKGSCVVQVAGTVANVMNNILFNSRIGLEQITGPHSYNVLYNDTNYSSTAPGTGEVTHLNPLLAGLRYLPRVEDGSTLKTLGKSGGQVGAQIIHALGTPGTLYGETGWDTLTDTPLWPWAREDTIKAKISAYGGHGVESQRGFCQGGSGLDTGQRTLTSYIWEYLGYGCPDPICLGENPPTVTTGTATGTGSATATLNGTADPEGEATDVVFEWGTDDRYGNSVYASQSPMTGTTPRAASAVISGLSPATTYHFRVRGESSGGKGYGSDQTFSTYSASCPDCSGDDVTLRNEIFSSGTICRCECNTRIRVGPNVKVRDGARLELAAPTIEVDPEFQAEEGAVVSMGQP